MNIHSTRVGEAHRAYWDNETGQGMLIRPPRSRDLRLDTDTYLRAELRGEGGETLLGMVPSQTMHEADFDAALRDLRILGFEPSESDNDEPFCVDGYLADGSQVIGLYGLNPIRDEPGLDEFIEATADLRVAVGLA